LLAVLRPYGDRPVTVAVRPAVQALVEARSISTRATMVLTPRKPYTGYALSGDGSRFTIVGLDGVVNTWSMERAMVEICG